MADNRRVTAAATTTAISIATSPLDRKRPHLHLLPSSVPMFGGHHGDGVLTAVAEATVVVLMMLQQVVDGSQPRGAGWTRSSAAPAETVAVSVTAAIPASTTAVRVHLFTAFTGGEKTKSE